ncbi:hypothetical protein TVAG_025630 [Trichomonas vaginalis G3]|uniref:receptor protein-tyrosine kinase n=1 Tax=Trichomonas vaginalis (strain ATCC PRA-98 / G3) TaxID=412133 RepID=A2F0I5_TRIV3|nr:glycine-rich protein family [Trichomonas vaginalis G3]EAY01565.1 hypothetical protein TVAG_025630 [Trichomonas vaginalis G3]KAI5529823.1 glycine-rich protein family [Trichomonas vaginalis G3]|eukprot:XP_001314206.1 hypothetical protein [Trichomonas vaginalis G3]
MSSIQFEFRVPRGVESFQLQSGIWLMKIWGAQGGSFNSSGGHGAYSEAILILDKITTLYAYVGAQGKCGHTNFTTGPFQGGPNKICDFDSCTGGSATFISRDPFGKNILLISGAGGGSGYCLGEFFGGVGSPFAGDALGDATELPKEDVKKVRGKGATSTRPGSGGIYIGNKNYGPTQGIIGNYLKGGDANCSASGSAGGGGSGYFGGGGGADLAGGGGGSSYASPDLYNVILLGGDKTFNSPSGNPVIGHTGDGFIRIEPSSPFTLEKNTIGCKCSYQRNNFILYSAHLFSIGLVSLMFA